MSGFDTEKFKDDVISILRQNVMLVDESVGLVLSQNKTPVLYSLVEALRKSKRLVVYGNPKVVVTYDYIVISGDNLSIKNLLTAFALVQTNGLIILEITDYPHSLEDKYNSWFGTFTATKVKFENRSYIVIHAGVDYGN